MIHMSSSRRMNPPAIFVFVLRKMGSDMSPPIEMTVKL